MKSDFYEHFTSKHLVCALNGFFAHNAFIARFECESERGRSVHNNIYPQKLYGIERVLLADKQTYYDHQHTRYVYGKLKGYKTLKVAVNVAPE